MAIRIDGTNTTANPGITGADADTGLQFGTDEVKIVTGGTDAVTVDASQRVGIGTTSVDELLHVEGAASGGTIVAKIQNNVGAADSDAALKLTTNSDTWQITSKYTGGALAISSAAGERARIDSQGRLLVGTSSSPSVGSGQYSVLKVQGYAGVAAGAGDISISRGQAASSGFSAGAGIGVINFTDSGGYAFGQIYCAADGTTAANDYPGYMAFYTTADGASSPTERLRITEAGNFFVFSNGADTVVGGNASGSGTNQSLFTGVHSRVTTTSGGTVAYRIYNNGTTFSVSDERQKKNIESTRDGYLEDIQQLRIVKYNWVDQPDDEPKELGLIAQEVASVFPGLVQLADPADPESTLGIKQSVFSFMLIKALQEAAAKIETLETRVAQLEGGQP